ncbi:MAG: Sua5/YciO/YrdC/YwlC family protein, partial [archaeon]|nr:Sua5/YciO/YrdC/YwlC family protein [archaeon]
MFWKISITGAVQGVGFRPFIYHEAKKRGLKGYVKNTGCGVEILIDDSSFASVIKDKKIAPPLSEIENIKIEKTEAIEAINTGNTDIHDFRIISSTAESGATTILPDISICDRCTKEIYDKKNRRKNYYYTTCTDCGPRFSIIKETPYDRKKTSMSEFKMCEKCRKEYKDPHNRRYHAQTIACPECGPKLFLFKKGKKIEEAENAIEKASFALKIGEIIAIKGTGGYHLVCDAKNSESITRLRKIIQRPTRPLAIMAKTIEDIKDIAVVEKCEQDALTSNKRPIVI